LGRPSDRHAYRAYNPSCTLLPIDVRKPPVGYVQRSW
jgi:hypothetical protein